MNSKYKAIEDFNANACEVCIDEDTMTCDVYVDVDGGWDSAKQGYAEVEAFAEGENDPMGCDIEEELASMGLELVYPGELTGDESISFNLERLKE